jgi:hypothetical protein
MTRARAIPLAADATVPAAPAARRNDRRLHIVDLIKNLLDLSGVHVDDHIIRERKKKASDCFLCLAGSSSLGSKSAIEPAGAFALATSLLCAMEVGSAESGFFELCGSLYQERRGGSET